MIAFSSAREVRRTPARRRSVSGIPDLPNKGMSPLLQAAIEATEEATVNSLLRAVTVSGYQGRTVEALPVDEVVEAMRRYGRLSKEALWDTNWR